MNDIMTISLCIITKNEEHCISRCLNSVQDIADEIIVVDTGSDDRTLEIANEYGARLFSFFWIDDFAAARNYAISKSKGQWILVLDADEILEPVSREVLFDFIQSNPAEGYYFKVFSYLAFGCQNVEDYVVRLFKNIPEYRFSGAIHEQVAGSILSSNGNSGLVFSPFTIFHYGYLSKELQNKKKFERNTTIIKKALAVNPEDPFLYYSLATEYMQVKDFYNAGIILKKTLTLLSGQEGYIPQVLTAFLLVRLNDPYEPNTEKTFLSAMQTLPECGDIYCLYGIWLKQHSRFSEAANILEIALSKEMELMERGRIYSFMGDIYCLANMFDKAVQAYINSLQYMTEDLYPFVRLLNLCCHESYFAVGKTLCNRITPEIAMRLLEQSSRAGLVDVSLSATLLVFQKNIEGETLKRSMEIFNAYQRKLATALPETCLQADVYNMLGVGGEKISLQCRLLEIADGRLNCIREQITKNVLQNLEIISSIVKKIAPDGHINAWEEVFIGKGRS